MNYVQVDCLYPYLLNDNFFCYSCYSLKAKQANRKIKNFFESWISLKPYWLNNILYHHITFLWIILLLILLQSNFCVSIKVFKDVTLEICFGIIAAFEAFGWTLLLFFGFKPSWISIPHSLDYLNFFNQYTFLVWQFCWSICFHHVQVMMRGKWPMWLFFPSLNIYDTLN